MWLGSEQSLLSVCHHGSPSTIGVGKRKFSKPQRKGAMITKTELKRAIKKIDWKSKEMKKALTNFRKAMFEADKKAVGTTKTARK